MPGIRERLRGVLRPGGYDPGDKLTARVKDIDGVERETEFEIERYCGGGFAGQVYRAKLVSSDGNWLTPGAFYALKFFSPRSGFRKLFRDIMYFLSFQSPFPHQFNEPAVRTGLYMTKLLKVVSQVEFGSDGPINDCYGTFWDDHVGACAELNEWVEGRVTDPDVDAGIFTRRLHNKRARRAQSAGDASVGFIQSETEIAKKKRFMAAIVRLCADLGIDDLARQVYWWTGMSQPNVLTRNSGSGSPEFVWVDRRPGLPGLLLSLGDFPLLTKAISRGSIPPFDRIDFRKFRSWPKAPDRAAWEAMVDQLHAADEDYRQSQIDILGHNVRIITSRKLRRSIGWGIVDYWHKTGVLDDAHRDRLRNGGRKMLPHLLLSCIPFLGRRLNKMAGNVDYRAHLRRMIGDGRYRWAYFDRRRRVNVAMWLREDRTSEARAERCLDCFPAYFRDRLFSWAPPSWQLFLTDWGRAKEQLKKAVVSAFSYVFNMDYRSQVNHDWVRERTDEDMRHGYLSREEAEAFVSAAASGAMQQYITGIMVTIALLPASEITFALLFIAGMTQIKDFQALKHALAGLGWWGIPLGFALLAMSPGGIMRFVYCIAQWIRNRKVPYGTAASLSMFRAVGYLSFPVQIAKTYPQFSRYMLTWSVCYLVNIVPVFGERGGLLNIWAVTALLSWPASFRKWRQERKMLGGSGA